MIFNESKPSSERPALLVVDDQPVNIRLVHELFRADYDLFMATTGEQALAMCANRLPDLILLDVLMPGIDGHEVCRQLKRNPAAREVPIIFITAQQEAHNEALCFELGAVDFISKPINPVTLRARVQTHMLLKRQSDALRSMALLDGLTGLHNRRKFDEELAASSQYCRRLQKPLSLVLIDVDFFKRFNDAYGHPAGDACLQAVAKAIASAARRPRDLAARYGGEEFACILPDTDAENAAAIARRMLTAVRELQIRHAASDAAGEVTVSIGVATLVPADEQAPALLIESADKQLYRAKTEGRARVASQVFGLAQGTR